MKHFLKILNFFKGRYRNLSISALEFHTHDSFDSVYVRRDRGPVAVEMDRLYGKQTLNYNSIHQHCTLNMTKIIIYVTVLREPWPLCTGMPGSPVVKAYQALVTALQLPQYGCHGPVKRLPEAYCQRLLPGTWCHMHHTELPVGGMYGATSPYMSSTGGIKAVATLSWGVLLPLW